MQDMYIIAEHENINIRWWNFDPPVLGVYWAPEGKCPVIGLDKCLEHNTKLLRTVFAEELGHHFTAADNCINNVCLNYRGRLRVSRCEYWALKWAAYYLMPEEELGIALRTGYIENWDLSDYFNVTEELARFRLGLLSA